MKNIRIMVNWVAAFVFCCVSVVDVTADDANNPFKFRVILDACTDSEVTLTVLVQNITSDDMILVGGDIGEFIVFNPKTKLVPDFRMASHHADTEITTVEAGKTFKKSVTVKMTPKFAKRDFTEERIGRVTLNVRYRRRDENDYKKVRVSQDLEYKKAGNL